MRRRRHRGGVRLWRAVAGVGDQDGAAQGGDGGGGVPAGRSGQGRGGGARFASIEAHKSHHRRQKYAQALRLVRGGCRFRPDAAAPGERTGQGGRDGIQHRPRRVAGDPRAQHRGIAAQGSGRPEDRMDRPGRRYRHDASRQELAQAGLRRQGRRSDRHVRDPGLARHGGRGCRSQGADDQRGRQRQARRAGGREAPLGLQDPAERCADGRRPG
ncbi:hypothetical protein G6F59_014254 [Rhizopus arrhizus]|nr:hypothetical protein G6F59_014254 [Rhizopus arrhizus]